MNGAFDFTGCLKAGHALILVPPFASTSRPSLAAHQLQACAAQAGIQVEILYTNMLLYARLGEQRYRAINRGTPGIPLAGERFFASIAFPDRQVLENQSSNERAHFRRAHFEKHMLVDWDE